MTQVCPKCNYARKPTDEAPEWQCPSCQVAYVKAREATSDVRLRPAPVAIGAEQSGNRLMWIVIALALGIGVWVVKPWHHAKRVSVVSTAVAGQPNVVLYGTAWCGYCAASREFFEAHGIQYTDVDIEKSKQGHDEYKKLGGRGVPLIVIGEEAIAGYSEEQMREMLAPWLR